MSACFTEIDFFVLLCHVDDHVEVASIGRNIVFWNAGGDVALIGLAIPMTTEGVVVRGHEPLDRLVSCLGFDLRRAVVASKTIVLPPCSVAAVHRPTVSDRGLRGVPPWVFAEC